MRVLVTGVANAIGGALARRLERQESVEAIFGLDVADPRVALERTEFVHADTRHSLLSKLVRGLRVDVVVHCAVLTESRSPARLLHETNVIGTMNLLAACSGAGSPVRRLVVKSSVAVYGCHPYAPSYLRESHRQPSHEPLAVDLREMEQLVSDFALRSGGASVATLRLGHRLGMAEPTPLGEYLRLGRPATFAGFDPRLQLLHEIDAVEALHRAALADHAGTYNVAGDGVLLLSQAIRLAGREQLSLMPPFLRGAARVALRTTGFDMPPYLADLLCHGCVVDCAALEREFGWRPAHTTRDTLLDFVRGDAFEVPVSGPQEYELATYLQRRRKAGRPVRPLPAGE